MDENSYDTFCFCLFVCCSYRREVVSMNIFYTCKLHQLPQNFSPERLFFFLDFVLLQTVTTIFDLIAYLTMLSAFCNYDFSRPFTAGLLLLCSNSNNYDVKYNYAKFLVFFSLLHALTHTVLPRRARCWLALQQTQPVLRGPVLQDTPTEHWNTFALLRVR